MPSDIFLSYSSRDRAEATQLCERLTSAGFSVWIDQSGLDVSERWSNEIANAIRDAKAMLLLLSQSSLTSKNVVKELTVASELGRDILPVALEEVELAGDFLYHLSGLHRVAHTDHEAILRALTKLGIPRQPPTTPLLEKEGEQSHSPSFSKRGGGGGFETRKSLMILPFEDLSPTQDNGWFADGIVSELVSALLHVKALRLIDWNTSKEFKTRKVPTATLAKELDVRYFLEGQVRKAGENIKVSVSLLDFETGDHLWQDSMKGTMDDVLDIQEKVAAKVVEGLKIYLASDEKKKLAERGTENAEAYELYLKAVEYFSRQTLEGIHLALQQLTLAIELDPNYADAIRFKAYALVELDRNYDRDPYLLTEEEQRAKQALEIKPDLWIDYE